jgi:hypothetical protein
MRNNLLENFRKAKQDLYDHVGFVEDWVVYAIQDETDCWWKINNNPNMNKKTVLFADNKIDLLEDIAYGNYYENEIYTQRFYKKHVYRGKDLTMIFCDTHTDGNKFFTFFDNKKELK